MMIRAQHPKRLGPVEGATDRLRHPLHETEIGDGRGELREEGAKPPMPRAGLVFNPAQEHGQRIGANGPESEVSFSLW